MKPLFGINKHTFVQWFVLCFATLALTAQNTFTEYKGMVVDNDSQKPLEAVNLTIKNTNISTITNADGNFLLKVPETTSERIVVLTLLGYQTHEIDLSLLNNMNAFIGMDQTLVELPQVKVTGFTSAEALVKKVFQDKKINNLDNPVLMTAFYRETIKRRNRNVSLTEAVVDLYKQSYLNRSRDVMKLNKARKSTDYKRLDTIAFKLQGGPFSTLYLDIMKYPDYIFTDETIPEYTYTFDQPTTVNDKLAYVVNFTSKSVDDGLGYSGKLFIDEKSLALVSAVYALDIRDKSEASEMFVKKKPNDVVVSPMNAEYRVNYQQKDGKWYYSYSNANLMFKVDKKRKLFNTVYTVSSEMAITDWETTSSAENMDLLKDRLRPSIIIADAVSGFSDPDFWGAYNLIEPDKSIESAIEKIRKNLKKDN